MFKNNKPYNDLPLLPPSSDIETKKILKLCIAARSALSELKQTVRLIPNPGVLTNSMPLLEAQSSSEIENIVTTLDELFKFADIDINKADPATKETLYYRTALYKGVQLIKSRPLCTATAISVMQILRQTTDEIRRIPGTALSNSAAKEIIYTPPCGEDVIRKLLSNWEHFINAEKGLDPLIVMSIMHYQFEAIHPFSDGNGRAGRILNILYLVKEKLLDSPVLYLSWYINKTKKIYYSRLINVTLKSEWEEWILYMLESIYETSLMTKKKIESIKVLFDETREFIQKHVPKIYSMELVETLFKQPYCRISNLVQTGIVKRQSGSVYLKELVNIGILEEVTAGREKLFIHKKLLQLLSDK